MRVGRVIAPKDVPARIEALLGALRSLGITPETPAGDHPDARAAVHTKGVSSLSGNRVGSMAAIAGARSRSVAEYLSVLERPAGRSGTAGLSGRAHHRAERAGISAICRCRSGPNTWLSVTRVVQHRHYRRRCGDGTASGIVVCALPSIRPSHPRSDRASGFCYVNNTAAAAQRLRGTFNRVAILDVDAHHGDGTQQIFYARPDVLTISIHADPRNYYPFFTGYANEIGHRRWRRIQPQSAAGPWLDGAAMMTAVDRRCRTNPRLWRGCAGGRARLRRARPRSDRRAEARVATTSPASARACGTLGLPTVVVQEGGYAVDAIGDCLAAFLGGLRRDSMSR